MRILAIETSAFGGSVAFLERDRLVVSNALTGDQQVAKHLAPLIKTTLFTAGCPPKDVELVAVVEGPGSFTGLRVGITTAKTFAYASGADVIGVNTLQAIAVAVPSRGERLSVVMDAQRKELFCAEFEILSLDAINLRVVRETQIIARDRWLAELTPDTIACGPGLEKLADKLPPAQPVAKKKHWYPTAHAVGLLGWSRFQQGERSDCWQLVPQYYRRSAAEEKL